MRKFVLFLVFLLSSFSANASAVEITPATDEQIEKARKSLEDRLLDSESARFKNVVIIKNVNTYFCGEVNAKNLYGAYTGYQQFMGLVLSAGHFATVAVDDITRDFCDRLKSGESPESIF